MKMTVSKESDSKSNILKNAKVLSITISSSIFAETTTFPLDLVKTRLQLQGDKQRIDNEQLKGHQTRDRDLPKKCKIRPNKNIKPLTEIRQYGTTANPSFSGLTSARYKSKGYFNTLQYIYQTDGARAFYKGLSPALMRHAIYSGTRVTLYEYGRDGLEDYNKRKRGTSNGPLDGDLTVGQSSLLAGLSGFIAQFIANPTDLMKVRLQSGEYSSLRQAYNSVPNFKSFWNGVYPNLGRAVMVNQGDLMTYDRLKRYLLVNTNLPEGSLLHFIASFGSGLVACILAMPFDTVKSRIMNQPIDRKTGQGKYYKSTTQAFKIILRNEGFFSFYRGFFAAWPRLAIWSQCFWHFNENIRGFMGLKPF